MILVDVNALKSGRTIHEKEFDIGTGNEDSARAVVNSEQQLSANQRNLTIDSRLSDFDKSMAEIINSADLSTYEKVKLYNEQMQRFLVLADEKENIRKRSMTENVDGLIALIDEKRAKTNSLERKPYVMSGVSYLYDPRYFKSPKTPKTVKKEKHEDLTTPKAPQRRSLATGSSYLESRARRRGITKLRQLPYSRGKAETSDEDDEAAYADASDNNQLKSDPKTSGGGIVKWTRLRRP